MKVVLIGMMGSGKSTLGRKLSDELSFEFIDTDNYIEDKYNTTIKEIFSISGESGFRIIEKEIFDELSKKENVVISAGGGAVLNRTLDEYKDAQIVFLDWTTENLFINLKNNTAERPLLSDGDLLDKICKIYDERKHLYEKWSKYTVNCNSKAPRSILNEIKKYLESGDK